WSELLVRDSRPRCRTSSRTLKPDPPTMSQRPEISNRFENVPAGTRVFRAPSRVNLIGEHTDYNGGFVMPAAINLATYVAVAPYAEPRLVVDSENFHEQREFPLADSAAERRGDWSDYVHGVAVTLDRSGFPLAGAKLKIRSEVPIGSGLSSSAALEVATA